MHSVIYLVIASFCLNCRGGNHTAQEDGLVVLPLVGCGDLTQTH